MSIERVTWGDLSVETMLQRQNQRYYEIGFTAMYMTTARGWRDFLHGIFPESNADELYANRRSEQPMVPGFTTHGQSQTVLEMHKIDSRTGIIIPSTTETIAYVEGEQLKPQKIFADCDLTVIMDAADELDSLGLKIRTVSGL